MGWRWVDFLNVRRLSLQIVSGIEVVHLITPRQRRSYDCVILLNVFQGYNWSLRFPDYLEIVTLHDCTFCLLYSK